MEWVLNQVIPVVRNYNYSTTSARLSSYYHYFHCFIFSVVIFCIFLLQSSTFSQKQVQLLSNGSEEIKPPNVIHLGNSNFLILLKSLKIGKESAGKKEQREKSKNSDEDYFVPFNCPCGSTVTTRINTCNNFECCACELKCPAMNSISTSYDKSEWLNQFIKRNCPLSNKTTTTTNMIPFEDRITSESAIARKIWSCDQPTYFLNLISSFSAAWFPYLCILQDNLMYLGAYYEKHPKFINLVKDKWKRIKSEMNYNWRRTELRDDAIIPNQKQSQPLLSTTIDLSHADIIKEIEPIISTNSSSRIKILGGSRCFRGLGLLRYGISSNLPCRIKLNIDSNVNCEEIRQELDAVADTLLQIHLTTVSNMSEMSEAQLNSIQKIKRIKLIDHTGIFDHEENIRSAEAQNRHHFSHCSNLTLGISIITTYYNNQAQQGVAGIEINYMKREDQIKTSTTYERMFHIASTTTHVNISKISPLSKFWTNILYTECPAHYCWRDLIQSAYPNESSTLLLAYEAELWVMSCFGLLGLLALLVLHEFIAFGGSDDFLNYYF